MPTKPHASEENWLMKRLREVAEEAKTWPAWYRNQPLTAEDAKRLTVQPIEGGD